MEPSGQHAPRVCMLLESYYPVVGGMETQARNMATALVASGVSMVIVTRRTSADLPAEERVDGIPVYRTPPCGARKRARWTLVLTSIPALVAHRREYDILFVPGFRTLGITAVLAGKLLGKRCVLKAESSGEFSGSFFRAGLGQARLKESSLPVRLLMGLRNRLLARADAYVSMSSELTEEFITHGAPAARIRMIPQTVEVSKFKPVSAARKGELRRKLSLPEGSTLVIFTGRLVSYKGIPVLLRVWNEIHRAHPDAAVIVVGAGGSDFYNCEEELRTYVREHQLERSVLFTGAVTNVEEYLQASDIFVFPTENEAFGISLIEAMACRLPVISTSIGGIKDILSDGRNGLMMAPGDAVRLREVLERLLTDKALCVALGEAALATVLQRYTREIVIRQYAEVFRECAAAR